jgi:hypothetical protein
MDNYLCEQRGYTERERESEVDQIMDLLIDLKYRIFSKSYINECFSKINSFYEANDLVIEI